jgi:hypothetical protein
LLYVKGGPGFCAFRASGTSATLLQAIRNGGSLISE